MMLQKGDILNDTYEIIGPIGDGGIGSIYKAFHKRLLKEVAIKLLKTADGIASDCRKEADILKELRHPYLPQVYDYVQVGGVIYTVLDYIPGRDLQSYLDEGYVFQTQQLYCWFGQICEALRYLHAQNPPIIHSDIKPANIMIKPDGSICLIDFNVSLGKGTEVLKGLSESYAAPEQIRYAMAIKNGEDISNCNIDERTDIYSLGATFYHLMTYHKPTCQTEQLIPITEFELAYPDSFVEIIQKCMEIVPKRRYQSVTQLLNVLKKIRFQDQRVKRLHYVRWGVNIVLILLMIFGCLVTYYGYCLCELEEFEVAYVDYLEVAEKLENPEDIIACSNQLMSHSAANMSLNRELEKYYQLYLNLANAYRDDGDLVNAANYYQKILQCDNPEIYREYAIYLIDVGEYEQATTALNQALQLGLESGEVYYVRGRIAEETQEWQEAILQYKKAISLLSNEVYQDDAAERITVLEERQ